MKTAMWIVCLLIICAVGYAMFFRSSVTKYRLNSDFTVPEKPYPTDRVLKITVISDIEPSKPVVKSPSIIVNEYTKKLECEDTQSKEKVEIIMTREDYQKLSLRPEDTIRAMGLEKSQGILFRLEKVG
jgi:hypothetical protein